MSGRLRIAFFGSSLVSRHWNEAAPYYRGIVRALDACGHEITFFEPAALDRHRHRDLVDPSWARVVVYAGTDEGAVLGAVERARDADVIVKASNVGVFDEILELAVLAARGPRTAVVFWDVDPIGTLERVRTDTDDPFRALVPLYDRVFVRGGGDPVLRGYQALGARGCVPVPDALDPSVHFRVRPEPAFEADVGLLANRDPGREIAVEELFFDVARLLRKRRFLLGGSGWSHRPRPANLRFAGAIDASDHNAFHSTPRAILVLPRNEIAGLDLSTDPGLLEAAGAGACIIAGADCGIERLLGPGSEVLVARTAEQVAALVERLDVDGAAVIGRAARARVLAHHTYAHRARVVEAELLALTRPTA